MDKCKKKPAIEPLYVELGYLELPAISNYFSIPLRTRDSGVLLYTLSSLPTTPVDHVQKLVHSRADDAQNGAVDLDSAAVLVITEPPHQNGLVPGCAVRFFVAVLVTYVLAVPAVFGREDADFVGFVAAVKSEKPILADVRSPQLCHRHCVL